MIEDLHVAAAPSDAPSNTSRNASPDATLSPAARWMTVFVLALVVVVATAAAPAGLRRIDAFHIDHVEIYGTHYMTPEQVLAASHITKQTSIFDDAEKWRAALLAQPLIATATVRRRLPNTAIVEITETRPVAFARTPELRPIDAHGRILAADPTAVDMDLPIIDTDTRVDAHAHAMDNETIRTAAVLGRLQELEPVLAPWVSEATPMRDGVRLSLRGPSNAEVLLPYDIDADRLRELRVTLADLAAPNPVSTPNDSVATTSLGYVTRIDVRYREQVVVSLHTAGTR